MRNAIAISACAAALIFSTTSQAAVIFNETYDAQRIIDEGLHPDNTLALNGSTVQLGVSQTFTFYGLRLEIPIFGAGVLSDSNQYTISLTVEENRSLGSVADQDPIFVIQDGNAFLGSQHADNEGGRIDQGYGTIDNSGSVPTVGLFVGQGTIGGLNYETWISTIQVGVTDSITTSVPTAVSTYNSGVNIDPSSGLSFAVYANDWNESYGINSISITVEGPALEGVPAPGALALLVFGVLGLGLRRRSA